MSVVVVPATADRFGDVAALLAPRDPDAPACWCLSYRCTSSQFNQLRGAERPAALRNLCEREVAPGVLAFERAGFVRLVETSAHSAGRRRWLMRLDLAAGATPT